MIWYTSTFVLISDQAALEAEAKVAPLINEKKRLYNELLTAKGKLFLNVWSIFYWMYSHVHQLSARYEESQLLIQWSLDYLNT